MTRPSLLILAVVLPSALLLLILALVTAYRPLYFLLYVGLLLLALSYLWSWIQTRGLDVTIETLSARPQVGSPLHLRITVQEKLGIPRIGLRLRLLDLSTREGNLTINLAPRAVSRHTVMAHQDRRGLNTIGAAEIAASDPLGLTTIRRLVGEPQTITVYPQVIPLVAGLSVGAASFGGIGRPSLMPGSSASASRVREYRPSDSLNRIHWPTTAKTNRLMSKEFDSGGHTSVWLILDLQASRQSGSDLESTEEYAITVAASLAVSLIESQQNVGLLLHADTFHSITPQREAPHLWTILDTLSIVEANGRVPLSNLLVRAGRTIPQGSLAVVIAPGPVPGSPRVFQHMYRRGVTVLPVLLDAASFEDSPNGESPPASTAAPYDGYVIRRGDRLIHSLANVMDRLVY